MPIPTHVTRRRLKAWIWLTLVPSVTVCSADTISTLPNDNQIAARAGDSASFARRRRPGTGATSSPPGTVGDLTASVTGARAVTLTFTQVTDGTGQPAHYDVRYAVAPISWGQAASVSNGTCTTPVAGTVIGAKLSCTVLGLSPSTAYNFQLVAFRDTLNVNAKFGGLSNVAAATTSADITASQLAMISQPSANAQSGAPFSQQPAVQLRSTSNQAVNQAGVGITAAIATGTNGTLTGTTTIATNANGVAAFSNLAIVGAGTYSLSFTASGLQPATSSPLTVTSGTTSTEPAYNRSTDKLILQDNFDGYTGIRRRTSPFVSRYNQYRAVGFSDQIIPIDSVVTLIPGRNGSGRALRLAYGSPGGATDIIVGPEGRLGSVGAWNGTLPEKAGPYTHFLLTMWIRFSAGADPSAYDDSGVKGIMLEYATQRYEHPPHKLAGYHGERWPETRWDVGIEPSNSVTGLNQWRTPSGEPPKFSLYTDGNWHRLTYELYIGGATATLRDPSGHVGERWWIDGVLIFDNVDNVGNPANWGGNYSWNQAITHWMVFGNYVDGPEASHSPFFTVDFDDWIAWTN